VTRLLGPNEVRAAVAALADRIVADMAAVPRWALVGIRTGGTPLADRLAAAARARGLRPLRGDIDITLYRDDLYTGAEKPVLGDTDLPFEVRGCGVVLVDDVLFTGRTVRAALGEVMDFGRPSFVRLCALVDRGHRELPIQADYVGARLPTPRDARVVVDWDSDTVGFA
jgi:pyrimidine operon attenuation protein/uracil phosphoribosyltransferase